MTKTNLDIPCCYEVKYGKVKYKMVLLNMLLCVELAVDTLKHQASSGKWVKIATFSHQSTAGGIRSDIEVLFISF